MEILYILLGTIAFILVLILAVLTKKLKQFFTILAILSAIIGLALSILPFGSIAIIPIIVAFISGLIAFKISQKEDKSTNLIKGIFIIVIVSLGLTIYNSLKANEIVEDKESIIKENQSEEDAIEELESIEIED